MYLPGKYTGLKYSGNGTWNNIHYSIDTMLKVLKTKDVRNIIKNLMDLPGKYTRLKYSGNQKKNIYGMVFMLISLYKGELRQMALNTIYTIL